MDRLADAMARMPPGQADELLVGLRALVDLAAPIPDPRRDHEEDR